MKILRFYFRKYILRDPLSVLFVTSEYMKGYKQGVLFGVAKQKREMEKILLADRENIMASLYSHEELHKKPKCPEKYGIFCGKIKVGKSFNTALQAYNGAKEILGDKCTFENSTYTIIPVDPYSNKSIQHFLVPR